VTSTTTPAQQLRAYAEYLRELGVYELYQRREPSVLLSEAMRETLLASKAVAAAPPPVKGLPSAPTRVPAAQPTPRVQADAPPAEPFATPMPKPKSFDELAPLPAEIVPAAKRAAALAVLQEEIGDCTRCPLAYGGRHKIVFADGDPNATLMFVGEGPGADEDMQGLPFVGKAGQLLNNMIAAMGLLREQVYIANIVKCRPPANRTPEHVEATTCSQFLLRQIDVVRPKVIVALGATAATYLLGVRQSLSSLRGNWYSARGAKVAVTYHPAFLLRDPRMKGEAWKDLQRVMAEMGLQAPAKKG
jgi:uracil-DNA glycosylase family 4